MPRPTTVVFFAGSGRWYTIDWACYGQGPSFEIPVGLWTTQQQGCWLAVRLTFDSTPQHQVVAQLKLLKFGIELGVIRGQPLHWIFGFWSPLQHQKIVIGGPDSALGR